MIGLRSPLRQVGLVALVSLTVLQVRLVRAEDAPPQPQSTPAPGPARPGPGGNRAANTPSSPATAEQHKLPPDSTTKQTIELAGPHAGVHGDRGLDPPVRRQGRAAGRHRLHLLSARWHRPCHASGDFPVQRRAGRVLGLSATRQCRTVAAADQWRRRDTVVRRRNCSPTPRPGSTSPISSSSIRSAPATAASSRPARMCASGSSRSTATSTRSRW